MLLSIKIATQTSFARNDDLNYFSPTVNANIIIFFNLRGEVLIYFDNAATGGFKPNASVEKAIEVMRYVSANPGRSGHRLSLVGANIVEDCRKTLARVFHVLEDRVIFTKNCTEALNIALFGFLKEGDEVISTVFEHNSVLRPLHALAKRRKVTLKILSPTPNESLERTVASAVSDKTKLIVMTGVSNVTGEVLPFKKIGAFAKSRNIPLLLDGAQAGGHIVIDMEKDGVSMLALAGHKGLYGIMGSGALLFSKDIDLCPLLYGGTGSQSFNLNQPEEYPDKLESGTLNLPAIASLKEGVKYAYSNVENFNRILVSYTQKLAEGLREIYGVKVYSKPNPVGIVSFAVKGVSSVEIADILNKDCDIAVRGGLHCAPLLHKYLGTDEDGLTRVSLSVQNTSREIDYFLDCIKSIAKRYFSV